MRNCVFFGRAAPRQAGGLPHGSGLLVRALRVRSGFVRAVLLLCLALLPQPAHGNEAKASAGRWSAHLASRPFLPAVFAAVARDRAQLFVLQAPGKLVLTRVFAAAPAGAQANAAKAPGEAPKGVYFTTPPPAGADASGKAAPLALNYPNPVDKLYGRSGAGPLFSSGDPEKAMQQTAQGPLGEQGQDGQVQGRAIVLYPEDASLVAASLPPGTPVVLADSLVPDPKPGLASATPAVLAQRVADWADAWSTKSPEFFDFYAEEAYDLSTESFDAFRTQKVRLFRKHAWIRNDIGDISILEGPDYWVTWFSQEYSDPDSSSSGVRRLYWMRDEQGVFLIVGMEWLPGQTMPEPAARRSALLPARKQGDRPPVLSGQGSDPFPLAEGFPEQASLAVAPPEVGRSPDMPKSLDAARLANVLSQAPRGIVTYDHIEDPRKGVMARPDPRAFLLAERRGAQPAPLAEAEQPRGSGLHPAEDAAALAIPPLDEPARAGEETAEVSVHDASPEKGQAADQGGAREIVYLVPAESLTAEPKGDAATNGAATTEAGAASTAPMKAGADAPFTAPMETVVQAGSPGTATAGAPLPEDALALVTRRVEEWRKAWEAGDVDAYMAFYADRAVQGVRGSAKAIRFHKERVWPVSPPGRVELTDITVGMQNGKVVAAMKQRYADNTGKEDYGLKNLTFELENGVWLITREDWSTMPK